MVGQSIGGRGVGRAKGIVERRTVDGRKFLLLFRIAQFFVKVKNIMFIYFFLGIRKIKASIMMSAILTHFIPYIPKKMYANPYFSEVSSVG